MKKILVLCLTAVLCLCCLTACGERKWKCSDTHHWILSPQIWDNTGEIYFYGKHIDRDDNWRCDMCGYEMELRVVNDILRNQAGC